MEELSDSGDSWGTKGLGSRSRRLVMSSEKRTRENFKLELLDRPSKLAESMRRAVLSGEGVLKLAERSDAFWPFVAICGTESGALDRKLNDMPSSEVETSDIGTAALEQLRELTPNLVLEKTLEAVKKLEEKKSQLEKFTRKDRSEVVEKAVKAGAAYGTNTLKLKTIESCDNLQVAKEYLVRLWNYLKASSAKTSASRKISRFEKCFTLETDLWKLWSFYDTCLKCLQVGDKRRKGVNAENVFAKYSLAYEKLKQWVTCFNAETAQTLHGTAKSQNTVVVVTQPMKTIRIQDSPLDPDKFDSEIDSDIRESTLEKRKSEDSACAAFSAEADNDTKEQLHARIQNLEDLQEQLQENYKCLQEQFRDVDGENRDKDLKLANKSEECDRLSKGLKKIKKELEELKTKYTQIKDEKQKQAAPVDEASNVAVLTDTVSPAEQGVCSEGMATEEVYPQVSTAEVSVQCPEMQDGSVMGAMMVEEKAQDTEESVQNTAEKSPVSTTQLPPLSAIKLEVEEISDPRRPSETAKRFEDLFTHTYSVFECMEEAMGKTFDDKKSNKFLFDILTTVDRAASLKLEMLGGTLVTAMDLSGLVDNPVAKKTINDCTASLCKISSDFMKQSQAWIWTKAIEFQKWRQQNEKKTKKYLQHMKFLKSVDTFVSKCVPVYWDMLLQKHRLIPVYHHTTFSPLCHERFYDSDETVETILYFAWPCLIEEGTNRVLVKGRVVTKKQPDTEI